MIHGMWNDAPFTRLLGLRYPIVQGPFGGGFSSARLTATISNAGGLGSFGAQGQPPARMAEIVGDIRQLTAAPFAVNLWVSRDDAARTMSRADYEAALQPLAPLFEELGASPPAYPFATRPSFGEQVEALIAARPPIISFIFGIPSAAVLDSCHAHGIVTMGVTTTPQEARACAEAGIDVVVASGFEAGGHRASFMRSAAASLTGTFALVPQVVDAVEIPVVAAGGIADARGVAAALTLGAHGAQIGTAFLACEESNAPAIHKEVLHGPLVAQTALTTGFSGRLARGVRNALADLYDDPTVRRLPYPLQGQLVGARRERAIAQGRLDLISLWSGSGGAAGASPSCRRAVRRPGRRDAGNLRRKTHAQVMARSIRSWGMSGPRERACKGGRGTKSLGKAWTL
jgi:nitronate monooxygenase